MSAFKRLDDSPCHEAHPELFHYTSAGGIEGILRSQSLWGTHWQYLNDVNELRHFSAMLPSLLKGTRLAAAEKIACNRDDFKEWAELHGGIEFLVNEEVQGLVQSFHDSVVSPNPARQIFDFYVTSFCTPEGSFEEVRTHGQISMWRYYGCGGYALVFDTASLENLLRVEVEAWPSRMVFGDVGYSCDPPHVLESRITALPELKKKFAESTFDSPEAFQEILEPLLDCYIHYKHWAFAEEREVRLTTILNGEQMRIINSEDDARRCQREAHIELGSPRIHLFEGLGSRLPIKRVIVGPGEHQGTREAELRALQKELKLDIPVILSNIPMR